MINAKDDRPPSNQLSRDEFQQVPEALRQDLDAGLRFLHLMAMQTKLDLVDMVSTLFALMDELVKVGNSTLKA
ncbi:hypothetical protein [Leptolyngbya sp. FACHB-17]|uniref:hypothetical protein n=1 Tax=unclassified Leptolyngbya TaxID=2650499 RepID=UPI0016814498|nr:hypothetical protein [Leptolyngbya sp. FACHB-17]MBD2080953.1 hypothetical protein [Leptolyngbya sp. FACHB-17]